MQETFEFIDYRSYAPPKQQLLKWIGNKQRFASLITKYFPKYFNTYLEPFLGSAAVLATVSPENGIGADSFKPLIDILLMLKNDPNRLVECYRERVERLKDEDKKDVYEDIKASFNRNHNGADFLFLSRACYGGVIRFRKRDGYMSTPVGIHTPIKAETFKSRVYEWTKRVQNTEFFNLDYKETFEKASYGDLVYCDPPYSHSQTILYGAQAFNFNELIFEIDKAKSRGVKVALSIDGNKKSGSVDCEISLPKGLFEQEIFIDCGVSMLNRFQMTGKKLENEKVSDRLLLTY
ncbi:MAG: Dam family site-specific DNA-(adenine-N6)-methyltransferase [Chlorobi bacterium]|nr:Dam family site-specific DNA-(adenine-N6)-methyltransferase [Chlorobiota bacterium]